MGIADKTNLTDEDALVPIVVGVTGHRDIHDSNRNGLEHAARNVFEGLRSLYPDSPIVLVSALAEGSDRLVARVGLDLGLKLIVPLPAPIEECESRLEAAESRSEFKELLGRAERYFLLPPQENGVWENRGMGEPSHDNYDRVRAFLARQCHILVALWDGAEADGAGGTAQSVRFRLKGAPEFYSSPRNLLDSVDTGPVYHILTPRASNPTPEGERYSLKKLFPSGWETGEKADKAFAQVLERINEFNRDAKEIAPGLVTKMACSKEEMITSEHSALTSATRAILEHFAVASALSMPSRQGEGERSTLCLPWPCWRSCLSRCTSISCRRRLCWLFIHPS